MHVLVLGLCLEFRCYLNKLSRETLNDMGHMPHGVLVGVGELITWGVGRCRGTYHMGCW